jgi:Fic/DOC family
MNSSKRTFSLADQPEVFASTTADSEAIRQAVAGGKARQLGGRLYTRNRDEPLEAVARRNWQRIAAHHFPDAVVVDRSAFEAKPDPDGSVFLDAGPAYAGRRPVRLPGLTLRPRRGPGPAAGDMPYMGIYLSSRPRALLDNMRQRRGQRGLSRTLARAEMEEQISALADRLGDHGLNQLRNEAHTLASSLDRDDEFEALDDLIGATLGTRDSPLETGAARARSAGIAFDRHRIELFATLQAELLRQPLPTRLARPGSLPAIAFFEAYFSNWIEGTEFELDEAEEIVFEHRIPAKRPEDAHDVLGTYELVADPELRSRLPKSPEAFLEQLREIHARMLGQRASVNPGEFKERANRAGPTSFVAPDLVVGTLIEGYRYYEPVPDGLSKAIFLMFLISEVHPFTDGNGRVGRVFMNAALSASGEERILVPLSYRDDYLGGLRALSQTGDPAPLLRVLDFAQRYATGIDWTDLRRAQAELEQTNAFVTPEERDRTGKRLVLPTTAIA